MTSAFVTTISYHRLIMRAFTFLGFLLDIIKQNLCLYEEGIVKMSVAFKIRFIRGKFCQMIEHLSKMLQ
jgi:hypothetical protein